MTYATNRLYCDADSHIMETRDWVANFTDPEIRAKLPEMSLLKSGTKSFEVIREAVIKQKQRASLGAATVDVVKGVKGWNAPGAFDAAKLRPRWTIWALAVNWCSRPSPPRSTCITATRTCATAAFARITGQWLRSARPTRGS
jgi:hypothetical protein